MEIMPTADVCDCHESAFVLPFQFRSFGKKSSFCGLITTLETFEDNSKVKTILKTPGKGRVLLIDGGASLNKALLGGNLAKLAAESHWEGIVILGAIRDLAEIKECKIGVMALGTCPKKGAKNELGEIDKTLTIGNQKIKSGCQLYADKDGVVILP